MTGPIAGRGARPVVGRIDRRVKRLAVSYGPELITLPFDQWTNGNVATIALDATGITFTAAASGDNARCNIVTEDDTTYKVEVDTINVSAGGCVAHVYGPTATHHGAGANITTATTSIQEITTTGASSILSQFRMTANGAGGSTLKVTRVSVKKKIISASVVPATDPVPATYTQITVDNTGATDVTAAINAALALGGNRYLPAGTYLIDPLVSLLPVSNSKFQLHAQAILQLKTNGADSYSGIYVNLKDNVEVFGGQIRGERDTHTGTTGEGGHGIRVHGSTNIKVHDVLISECWGDGLYIGPNRDAAMVYSNTVEAWNITVDHCRRNALSITNADNVLVRDSTFKNTIGTSPQCGCDIEPNADVVEGGTCTNIELRNCIFQGNQSYGVNIQRRAHLVNINGCQMIDNNSCGMVAIEAFNLVMTGNTIKDNGNTGLFLKLDVQVDNVSGNFFSGNSGELPRGTPIVASGEPAGTVKDLIMNGTGSIGVNTYS